MRHDQVVLAGGLHIIGSERHESRRIDNQLRGRSGRQGDPGSSPFYYPSRLHYTSDYFYDNVQKGVVRDLTKGLGGVRYTKTVNFLSTHAEAYPQLKDNPRFVELIRAQEESINGRSNLYVPKGNVAAILSKIQSGDILGTTTSKEGLDTSHTGIALRQDDDVHFMHAPLAGGAVEISKGNLAEYLARNTAQTGIMIVRPLEPA